MIIYGSTLERVSDKIESREQKVFLSGRIHQSTKSSLQEDIQFSLSTQPSLVRAQP